MSASGNLVTIENLAARLGEKAPLIGLDLGTKTIGIAVSDALRMVATPRYTLVKKKFSIDVQSILQLVEAEGAAALVIGLPLNMDATEGPRAQASRAFARNLAAIDDIPVVLWDERLTTVAAERAMLEADLSRRKRAEKIDAVAASLILQGALDRLANIAT